MAKSFWQKKWLMVVLHLVTWTIMFSLPHLLKADRTANDREVFEQHKDAFIALFIIINVLWIGLFYLNAYVLIPQFIYRRKVLMYIVALMGYIGFMLVVDVSFFMLFIPDASFSVYNFFVFNFFPLLFILLGSTAYRLIIDRIESRQRAKDRIAENLKTELSLLRSQVSPHFMFNVLNNMVALARKKSDLLEPSLIKLSQLLRYMLYAVDINTEFDIGSDNHSIEPMLLIPFVENAFKHGAVMIQDPMIEIRLKGRGKRLDFSVRNKYRPEGEEVKDEASGIGLVNVERRLKLLYPGKHALKISKEHPWFEVQLNIDLE